MDPLGFEDSIAPKDATDGFGGIFIMATIATLRAPGYHTGYPRDLWGTTFLCGVPCCFVRVPRVAKSESREAGKP